MKLVLSGVLLVCAFSAHALELESPTCRSSYTYINGQQVIQQNAINSANLLVAGAGVFRAHFCWNSTFKIVLQFT